MAPRRPEQHAAQQLWQVRRSRAPGAWAATTLLALVAAGAWGQSTGDRAEVSGIVRRTGNTGFAVTLRNVETGLATRTARKPDGSDGLFVLPDLEPGTYDLTLEVEGSLPLRTRAFPLGIGRTADVEFTLRGEGTGPEVKVHVRGDGGQPMELPDENDDGLISVHGLPATESRAQVDGLSSDQSYGAVPQGAGSDAATDAEDDSDSAEVSTGPGHGLGRGRHAGAAYSFSSQATREFRIREGSYSAATSGGGAGEWVVVSRSGAKTLHGSLLVNLRSGMLAAHDPYAIATSYQDGLITSAAVKPQDLRTNVAGTVGGALPRVRNGFFFYALDVQRRNFPAVSSPADPNFYRLTPTQIDLLGNRQVTRAQINSALNYVSSLTGETPRRADQTINFVRLDWQQHSRLGLTLEYNRVRYKSPAGLVEAPTVARGRASLGNAQGSIDAAGLHVSSSFAPGLLNEIRLGYTHDLQYETAQPNLAQEPLAGASSAPGGMAPEVNIGPNGLSFGTPASVARTAYPDERRLEAADTLRLLRGRHSLALGGSLAVADERVATLANAAGTFHYDSGETRGRAGGLVDFITDYTYNVNAIPNGACPTLTASDHLFCFRTFTQSFGEESVAFRTWDMAAYVEETWRPSMRLSVHAGVRYEYTLLPLPQKPNAALDGIFGALSGAGGATSIFPEDRNNIGPRAAVSYRAGSSTTVRLGYGLFFGRLPGATIRSALANTGQPSATTRIRITPAAVVSCPQVPRQGFGYPCSFATQPGGLVAQTTSAMVFDRNFRLPVVQQGSVGVERELGRATTIDAEYVINLDRQLPNSTDINIAPSTTTRHFVLQGGTGAPGVRDGESFDLPVYTARITPAFGPVTDILSSANATYHALALAVESRAVPRLALRARGVWSKAIDFGPSLSAVPRTDSRLDPFTSGYDKGLSSLNYPWALRADAVWRPELHASGAWVRALADGWDLEPLMTLRSGRPYSLDLFGGTRLPGGHASLNGSGGALYLPTVGRNTLRLPPVVKVDARVTRSFPLGARARVVAAAEAFNLLNSRNVSSVSQRAFHVGPDVAGTTPLVFQDAAAIAAEGLNTLPFGAPTAASSALTRARRLALSVRLEF